MSDFQIPVGLRQQVIDRAFGCCEYCVSQEKFSPDPFSVEHTIPRSKGGSNEFENLALSCQGCNGHKHTATEAIDPINGKSRHCLIHKFITGRNTLYGMKISRL